MIITQLNTSDTGGGAEQIASELHRGLAALGHESSMLVGRKASRDPAIIEIPRDALSVGAKISRRIENALGREDFAFPASHRLLSFLPKPPDIVHAHNLHGRYFDLRALPALSLERPLVLTLHDAWLLSGHCAHSFGCERWKAGCGRCPDLTIYPDIAADGTAFNWRRKRGIYAASRLNVVTPCEWLMKRVRESILDRGIAHSRIIPNGVDLGAFRPAEKTALRKKLGLPEDAAVITASLPYGEKNIWRDYPGTLNALDALGADAALPAIYFLALGMEGRRIERGKLTIVPVPYLTDRAKLAEHYQAADLLLHAARADTFPTVILEALACGVPVVTTATGGIPEQIAHGETGFITPPGDSRALAAAAAKIIADRPLREQLAKAARLSAESRFDRRRMIQEYVSLYGELLETQAHVRN